MLGKSRYIAKHSFILVAKRQLVRSFGIWHRVPSSTINSAPIPPVTPVTPVTPITSMVPLEQIKPDNTLRQIINNFNIRKYDNVYYIIDGTSSVDNVSDNLGWTLVTDKTKEENSKGDLILKINGYRIMDKIGNPKGIVTEFIKNRIMMRKTSDKEKYSSTVLDAWFIYYF
jgi:hypothetical protein